MTGGSTFPMTGGSTFPMTGGLEFPRKRAHRRREGPQGRANGQRGTGSPAKARRSLRADCSGSAGNCGRGRALGRAPVPRGGLPVGGEGAKRRRRQPLRHRPRPGILKADGGPPVMGGRRRCSGSGRYRVPALAASFILRAPAAPPSHVLGGIPPLSLPGAVRLHGRPGEVNERPGQKNKLNQELHRLHLPSSGVASPALVTNLRPGHRSTAGGPNGPGGV